MRTKSLLLFTLFPTILAILLLSFSAYSAYTGHTTIHASQCEVDKNGTSIEYIDWRIDGVFNEYNYAKEFFCPVNTIKLTETGDENYELTSETISRWYFCAEDNHTTNGSFYYDVQVQLCFSDYDSLAERCTSWKTLQSGPDFECYNYYDHPNDYDDDDAVFFHFYLPGYGPGPGYEKSYLTTFKVEASY